MIEHAETLAMNEWVQPVAETCAAAVELLGVGMLTTLSLHAIVHAAIQLARRSPGEEIWQQTRTRLARSILVGLEFLVVADIIHTVAVELTFETVAVLAIIVGIRTFLSFSLEVELNGHWPWQGGGRRV
jgi:uncharacterized membrane protein